ncbi:MAG: DoxX family protein [Planctomycetota bacterium]
MRRFFRPRSQSALASSGLAILRIVAGAAMMYHGFDKIQTPFDWADPGLEISGGLQALAALSEFGGGLAWVLGFLTPLASLGMIATMAKAVHLHAIVWGDPFVSKGDGSYELAAIYLAIAFALLFIGPGRFSVDQALFGSGSRHVDDDDEDDWDE